MYFGGFLGDKKYDENGNEQQTEKMTNKLQLEAVFDDSKMKKFKCNYNMLSDVVRWVINNEEY